MKKMWYHKSALMQLEPSAWWKNVWICTAQVKRNARLFLMQECVIFNLTHSFGTPYLRVPARNSGLTQKCNMKTFAEKSRKWE